MAFTLDTPAALATIFDAARPLGDELAYALGLDHARHGLRPPAELLLAHPPLRRGWEAGRLAFAGRTRAATPQARQWLLLRLEAGLQGHHVELLEVTPHYLAQLGASHCPITRHPLSASAASGQAGAAAAEAGRISRVCEQAAYAAGNLAHLGDAAIAAKAGLHWQEAFARAAEVMDGRASRVAASLSAGAWARLGVLLSFVTEMPHERAARLPLLVLPPNRLRLLNPVQGLQALVTLQLARSGWSQRLPAFEALLPAGPLRQDFKDFFLGLLTRALALGRPDAPAAWRHALEDAWRDPRVLQAWTRFALALGAERCERLLDRAAAEPGLCSGQRLHVQSAEQATEAWSLQTGGYRASRLAGLDDLDSLAAARPPRRRPVPAEADLPLQHCLPLEPLSA
ncbi:MAG: hypothetical protein RL722_1995 [Pseudomonadota bacterium]|jgi:hypothetical protein